MPSDKSIAIRVNKFPIVYSPGETITGEAVVDLDEAATCRGISLRFKGRSKVHWSETRGTGKNRRTVYYRAEENYFGTEVYVVGSSHGEIELVGGQHIFPFTFTLPMNIPNSFEHKYGDVVYNIKAVMDIAWALDPECYLPFTVYSPLDITQIPSHIIEDEVHAEYCCCILPCLGQGFMEARIHIPKSTYEVGDELDVIIEIIASSRSVDIQAIRLRLKQQLEFHAESRTKSQVEVLQSTEKHGPFPTHTPIKIGLQVPSILHSGFQYCNLIDIKYLACIRFVVSDCHCDTKSELPITIGSRLGAIQEDSASFVPPTAPVATPTSSFPTAPGMNSPGIKPNFDTASYNPVPAIGFQIPSPSAPADPASLPPPPSYESVMAQDEKK